jgi:hypothetical protein
VQGVPTRHLPQAYGPRRGNVRQKMLSIVTKVIIISRSGKTTWMTKVPEAEAIARPQREVERKRRTNSSSLAGEHRLQSSG